MAKLIGPLMSFGARGQIGKAMVTSKWKGIDYARQYVIPANPRTTAQQANRTRFALLREMWKLSPPDVRLPWTIFALGRNFLNFNAFVGENNRLLNGQMSMETMLMSPGARGGLPPQAVAATNGSNDGELEVTITPPDTLPSGWTIRRAIAAAIRDQDPTGIFSGPFVAGSDATPPYSITLSGFELGDELVAFGFLEYEKPNGELAYSVSLSDTLTIA